MCVYQFKVRLFEISPMIWRRLLVPGSTDIAELQEYGISYVGGIGFSDNPRKVWLKDFDFRVGDKFHYEYDFGDRWKH